MVTVYFFGGEDSEWDLFGTMQPGSGNGRYRTSYARGSIREPGTSTASFAQNKTAFAASNFWCGARTGVNATSGGSTNAIVWALKSSDGVVRLRMRTTGTATPQTFVIEKLDAAAAATTLITSSLTWTPTNGSGGDLAATKLDIHVNYAVAGSFDIYYNTILIGTFTGDVTTNSVTSLAFWQIGVFGNGLALDWSEMMALDIDTRPLSLQTFAPVANGNTHNFDTGTPAAANVNEFTLNYATLDGSTTAGQIDEYTQPAVVAGTFGVIAFGVSALMQKGATGPSKADLAVRTGGADFFTTDFSLTGVGALYQFAWLTNPNTSVAWVTTDIGAASGFNIGVKSVT